MIREIKYLRIDSNGIWREGYLYKQRQLNLIYVEALGKAIPVMPETLCGKTEYKDREGKEIFEYDVIEFVSVIKPGSIFAGVIVYKEGSFGIITEAGSFLPLDCFDSSKMMVLYNKIDRTFSDFRKELDQLKLEINSGGSVNQYDQKTILPNPPPPKPRYPKGE